MMVAVDYLPMAVNVVQVWSAVIVPPARACTAFECTHRVPLSSNKIKYFRIILRVVSKDYVLTEDEI